MRTLGIDLAAQPPKTAACVIDWSAPQALVTTIEVRVNDEKILSLCKDADWIGIDSPFGWPAAFSQMIADHDAGSGPIVEWTPEWRDRLRFRLTDHYVLDRVGLQPLSVSASWLAIVAMRCRGLLAELHVGDRSGADGIVEVYPAAALRRWRLIPAGFKGPKNPAALADLAKTLQVKAPWLILPDAAKQLCAKNDHAFDALICALVARATALGLTEHPAPEQLATAKREGWIALPCPGSLAQLPNAMPPGD